MYETSLTVDTHTDVAIQPAIESWLRSAPGFEGEVVKRMINCVSRQVTPQVNLYLMFRTHAMLMMYVLRQSQGPLGQTEPDKREQTPELDAVSLSGRSYECSLMMSGCAIRYRSGEVLLQALFE
eukprot:TRINITY_DN10986_c0_g1_i1.p1 TRINITY_DN10986_c0_g1~~TRINITY_DN10986_c0_g1_i1.p1  ORF type:complete len:124 (+),score=1.31 TRINITY_DN10986_c0_g1_i1:189-560(+)